jgi:heme exporter protein B
VWKDALLELRTRERISSMGAFAVLAAVLFNYSIDTTLVRMQDVAAGLIWMTFVFAGLLGIGRTFHLEAQDDAFQGVLLSPAPKDAVFLGKVLANFVLLFAVALLVLGVFTLFFGLDIGSSPVALLLALRPRIAGLRGPRHAVRRGHRGHAHGRDAVAHLVFPLLVPMVIYGVGATAACWPTDRSWRWPAT